MLTMHAKGAKCFTERRKLFSLAGQEPVVRYDRAGDESRNDTGKRVPGFWACTVTTGCGRRADHLAERPRVAHDGGRPPRYRLAEGDGSYDRKQWPYSRQCH